MRSYPFDKLNLPAQGSAPALRPLGEGRTSPLLLGEGFGGEGIVQAG
ncbi:MAG: hypothetical protein ACK44E_00315 [Anaerolineales bacterium]